MKISIVCIRLSRKSKKITGISEIAVVGGQLEPFVGLNHAAMAELLVE